MNEWDDEMIEARWLNINNEMMKWLKLEYYLIYTGMMKEMDSWVRNEKILIKGLLYWDWEEVSIYEYEKDKDITMLVCS